MKKKLISFILCFSIFTSSLSMSFADSKSITGGSFASMIYAIGRVVSVGLDVIYTSQAVMDLGYTVYYSFDQYQKDNIPSLQYKNGEYVVTDEFSDYIWNAYTVKSTDNKHIVPNVFFKYVTHLYHGYDWNNTHYQGSNCVRNHAKTFEINGTTNTIGVCLAYDKQNSNLYYFYNNGGSTSWNGVSLPAGFDPSRVTIEYKYVLSNGLYYMEFYSNVDGSYEYLFRSRRGFEDKCSNCPHDFTGLGDNNKFVYDDFANLDFPEDVILDDKDNPPYKDPSLTPPGFPSFDSVDFAAFDFSSLGTLFDNLKNKFPFSIPSDLVGLISSLNADPIAPNFSFELVGEEVNLDFSIFSEWAFIIKTFITIMYIYGLFFITKKVMI